MGEFLVSTLYLWSMTFLFVLWKGMILREIDVSICGIFFSKEVLTTEWILIGNILFYRHLINFAQRRNASKKISKFCTELSRWNISRNWAAKVKNFEKKWIAPIGSTPSGEICGENVPKNEKTSTKGDIVCSSGWLRQRAESPPFRPTKLRTRESPSRSLPSWPKRSRREHLRRKDPWFKGRPMKSSRSGNSLSEFWPKIKLRRCRKIWNVSSIGWTQVW